MARPDKAAAVEEIKQRFANSDAVLLTEYRGLTVAQLKELRVSLGENVSYAVVKNTLTKIAAKEAGVTGLDEHLNGPTAIAFVNGEPPEAAKALRNFAKANPQLVVKGGYFDGAALSPEQVNQAAYLFTAPLVKAARTVDALREKQDDTPAS